MLTVDKLVVRYEEVLALKGVTLSVTEGTFVSIIGPNGAGKTTLLRGLCGLVPISSGAVLFDGKPITAMDSSDIVKRGLLLCPEGRKLVGTMSVEDNLRLGAYTRKGNISKDLNSIYEIFPVLAKRKKQQARTLSGGEQQMLAIGRSLMGKPRLLAMDEVTLGLAPILVEEIGKKLVELHQRGLSILLVEQNAMLALRLSDICYVLELGNISNEGAPSELIRNETIREAYLGLD